MSGQYKLNGSLEEQVEKAHSIIGDVASDLRTFKKSIPAGSLINETSCGDEDMYLSQVIDNLWDELVKHAPANRIRKLVRPNVETARFKKPKEVIRTTRDEAIALLVSSKVEEVYREYSTTPVCVEVILNEHENWKASYSHAIDAKVYGLVYIADTDNDFAIVKRYENGLYSIIYATCPCKASGSRNPIKYKKT